MFKCERCGYNTSVKCNIIKHINRKKICKPILSEIIPKDREKEILDGVKEGKNCEYCDKFYSREDNLTRHLKKCSKKPDESLETLKELVKVLNEERSQRDKKEKEMEKEIKDMKEIITKADLGNTTNNYITNNNLNIVLPFKDTDISHLTDRDYYNSISRCILAIPLLIEKIHFNENKPENFNIYISNKLGKYVMQWDGSKWVVKNKIEAIDDLIRDNEYILEDWAGNVSEKYPKVKNKLKLWTDKRDEKGVPEQVRREIEEMLYNNRDKIEEPKKKTKFKPKAKKIK
jgi:hypothetical protein